MPYTICHVLYLASSVSVSYLWQHETWQEWPSIKDRYDPRVGENIHGKSTLRRGEATYFWRWIPSGKPTKNDGKSPFFMGKSTINGDFQ